MDARQVVALEVVIDIGLPVAFHLINSSLIEPHFVKAELVRLLR